MMLSTKFPIISHGHELNGYFFMSEGMGPHPTVLIHHGFPGREKHFDIASALRESGYNAIIFSYRGCWSSDGSYAFQHVLEDSQAAIAHLQDSKIAEKYRIDTSRVFLLGHSMGAWASLMSAANGSNLRGVIAMATFNLGYFSERLHNEPDFKQTLVMGIDELGTEPLAGTSSQKLADEIEGHYHVWDPRNHADALLKHALFMISATNDIYAPKESHNDSIVTALRDAGHHQLDELVFESDHSVTGQREKLIENILAWLDQR